MASRADYPQAVAELLGKLPQRLRSSPATPRSMAACRATAPRRAAHAVRQCTAAGTLRGIAQFDGRPPPATCMRWAKTPRPISSRILLRRRPVRYQDWSNWSRQPGEAFEAISVSPNSCRTFAAGLDGERAAGFMLQAVRTGRLDG
jgi:hypothetical protein